MKVSIIGSGISGLTVGCYLQMCGFETEIHEKHSSAGGLCTSWKRGEYTFESGLQWILGSGPASPFYHLWSELIDMESIRFVYHETRMVIETKDHTDPEGNNVFYLYTDLERLKNYMISIAPEDKSRILKLIRSIRKIQRFEIPPGIKAVPQLLPFHEKIKYARYLPLLLFLNRVKKITNFSFAAKLKNPFLKEAFMLLFDGDDLPLLILTLPLAFNDLRAAGYPVGGSSAIIERLSGKYRSLGGKINFNCKVEKILVAENVAQGVLFENGKSIVSDIIVSAADWHNTVFHALEGKYTDKNIRLLGEQKKLRVYYSVIMVSLGVSGNFKHFPHFFRFPLKEQLISPDGTVFSRMEVHNYNYDPTMAPEGKTVISLTFYTRNGEYWIDLRNSDKVEYDRQKIDFSQKVIGLLDQKIENLGKQIEVVDVATPATFHRYTDNWNGSVQGWLPGKNLIARSPVDYKLPGLKNFYFTSHWSIPGGGLPSAIKSARDLAQIICKNHKVKFKVPCEDSAVKEGASSPNTG
jgi:phytoene dehydrogenase-like protein